MTVARLEPNVPVILATASKKAAGKLLPPNSVPVRVYLKILSTIFTKAAATAVTRIFLSLSFL